MDWRVIGIVWATELRSALRERSIVVYSVLIPLLLYPAVLWLMLTGMHFAAGQTEGFASRVSVCGPLAARTAVARQLEAEDKIQLLACDDAVDQGAAALRRGELDVALWLEPPAQTAARFAGNYQLTLRFDGSHDRSVEARQRVTTLLEGQRQRLLAQRALAQGIDPRRWQGHALQLHNVASGREMGAFLLGLLLPVFLVVMVALGCFYPAIDTTAGERERGTWETTLTTAASRASVVCGKYLYVATMGTQAGLLNLVAMYLSMRTVLGAMLVREEGALAFDLPLAALPVLLVCAVLLALLAAAGMMVLAAFARTFKEGQSMAQPFYVSLMLGVILVQQPDLEFTLGLALVPVANLLLVARDALLGQLDALRLALTVATQVVAVALCLGLATWILRAEDVLVGSYGGSLWSFLKQRRWRRGSPR